MNDRPQGSPRPVEDHDLFTADQYNCWQSLADQYPGFVKCFREGERFYSLEKDAQVWVQVAGLTLYATSSGPYCHFPSGDLAFLLRRITRQGHFVLVCEALTDPSRYYFT